MAPSPQDCTILLVDDEPANLDLLEGVLAADGYRALVRTCDARQALDLFSEHRPDLVLLDLHMPHVDGFAVLAGIRARTPPGDYLPVLVLTADVTPAARDRALSGGARDFLTKPFDVGEVLLRVRNLLETRLLHRHEQDERARAEALAAENARLFAEAERATGARDRMLSVVAHDLRNPLALVAMNAELLLELLPPDAGAFQRETLGSLLGAASRMQRLIEDLLDVARIEHGTFALQLGDHAAGELLREVERLHAPTAAMRGVALAFPCGDALPVVRVDAARVVQVLSNLVGNAVKFTPRGGTVAVGCAALDDRLELRVADNGSGIPAEQLPHLFEAFWQAGDGDRRGVGLGLWIARAIAEAHGGGIEVQSGEGAGTTFVVALPRVATAAA